VPQGHSPVPVKNQLIDVGSGLGIGASRKLLQAMTCSGLARLRSLKVWHAGCRSRTPHPLTPQAVTLRLTVNVTELRYSTASHIRSGMVHKCECERPPL
jgi:hypothetical protein